MPITKREKAGVTILEVTGNLVIENSHELRIAVAEALEGGVRKIVLNLGEVDPCRFVGARRADQQPTPGRASVAGTLKLAAVTQKIQTS